MMKAPLNRRRALQTLFCSSAALALNLSRQAKAEVAKDGLHFLAIGDFGTGAADQKAVAAAMQTFASQQTRPPEALLLLGDNFYGPTKDGFTLESKRWKDEIEGMYPASAFTGPMYAVLGNHDYHDNAGGQDVQLAYAQQAGVRWKMPAKWYRQDFGPQLTVLFLDSNLPSVSGGSKDKKTGKPRASLNAKEAAAQLTWLKAELTKPRGIFTLVVAHHPIYSNGDHGDTQALVNAWEPLLQEHRVHAYLCGHDHDLQHLEMEGRCTSHILSGGGGARTRKLEQAERTMPYGKDVHGFTHLSVTEQAMTFAHYGVDGHILHRFIKRPDSKVEIG
jgi:tartrate-resistant acid phosphatase type 5